MADLAAAEDAREGAVTGGTHEEQARAEARWIKYNESIGNDDPFLTELSRPDRIRLLGAFAMALRERRFSAPSDAPLAESTIRGAIGHVARAFRDNDFSDPRKDEDGELGRLLQRQFRAFKNADPNPKQQKVLPASVIPEVQKKKSTETQKAIGQLAGGAFFFACRSCEYLKVPQAEKRRTDILKLRNIRFFRRGRLLSHSDPKLDSADCVSITFEFQKKDERNDTVTQRARKHSIFCPVWLWAAVVTRIRSYPGASDDTPVSAVWKCGRIQHVKSEEMVAALRDAVVAMQARGVCFGFEAEDIGTHSIRSGAAMGMYLGECPVYTIMMIGRWSSDAFLRYIRKQVEQFSHNVSERMVRFMSHNHIPDYEPAISHLDPRRRNHPDNEMTRVNVGGDLSRRSRLPAMSLFN